MLTTNITEQIKIGPILVYVYKTTRIIFFTKHNDRKLICCGLSNNKVRTVAVHFNLFLKPARSSIRRQQLLGLVAFLLSPPGAWVCLTPWLLLRFDLLISLSSRLFRAIKFLKQFQNSPAGGLIWITVSFPIQYYLLLWRNLYVSYTNAI